MRKLDPSRSTIRARAAFVCGSICALVAPWSLAALARSLEAPGVIRVDVSAPDWPRSRYLGKPDHVDEEVWARACWLADDMRKAEELLADLDPYAGGGDVLEKLEERQKEIQKISDSMSDDWLTGYGYDEPILQRSDWCLIAGFALLVGVIVVVDGLESLFAWRPSAARQLTGGDLP